MAESTYGKRMLKAGLKKSGSFQKTSRTSPDANALYFCQAGIDQDGLSVKYISDYKGYGVFTTQHLNAHDFLLQYCGEKITKEEAARRMKKHSENKFFFYEFGGKQWCIDAEGTQDHICQFVNDATDDASNSVMKLKMFNGREYLCLFAKRDIMPGEELLYNYGDEDNLWWRKEDSMVKDQFSFDEDSDPFDVNSSCVSNGSSYVSDSETSDRVPVELGFPESSEMAGAVPPSMIISTHEEEMEENEMAVPQVSYDLDSDPLEVSSRLDNSQAVSTDVQHDDMEENEMAVPQVSYDLDSDPLEVSSRLDNSQAVSTDVQHDEMEENEMAVPQVSYDLDSDPLEVSSRSDNSQAVSTDVQHDEMDESETPIPQVSIDTDSGSFHVNSQPDKIMKEEHKQMGYKKPERFCLYCRSIITSGKLRRHITRKHRGEEEVQNMLKQPSHVKNKFFDRQRREGIFEYNTIKLAEGKEPGMRERRTKVEDQLRFCSDCKGFYSNKYFFKHSCTSQIKPQAIKLKLLQKANNDKIEKDMEFKDILNRFRDGEVGDLCRTNKIIQLIGYRHFNLRRHEEGKQDEVRKVVMAEMRELSRMYLVFQSLNGEKLSVEDMFSREHLADLQQVIQQMVTDTAKKTEKHGQKLFLDAVILRSLKTLLGFYSETIQDGKRQEMKNFITAYKHISSELYPGARQSCVRRSLEKARKPANLPNEDSVKRLKDYIESSVKCVEETYSIKQYTLLRSLVVARLTLYNARRGEEASRMLQSEWEDAEKGVWLPDEEVEKVVDPGEQFLVGKFKLAYLKGKGRKYVPVLVPIDLVEAINILNRDRHKFGIQDGNIFLFATKNGLSHCSGWHAVSDICQMAAVDIPVNATKMRHRLSSIFASLDMTSQQQRLFLDHMGHDHAINKDNYQCPPGVQAVRVMGKMLSSVDEGTCKTPTDMCDDKKGKMAAVTTDNQVKTHIPVTDCVTTDDYQGTSDACQSSKEGKSKQVQWSKADNKMLKEYFWDFIFARNDQKNNKGNLPSKEKIMQFLREKKLVSIASLSPQLQYIKIRAKIFNERKSVRMRTVGSLQKLSK